MDLVVKITAAELDLIGSGLGSVPYKDAAPLIVKLQRQYLEYVDAQKPKLDEQAPASQVE